MEKIVLMCIYVRFYIPQIRERFLSKFVLTCKVNNIQPLTFLPCQHYVGAAGMERGYNISLHHQQVCHRHQRSPRVQHLLEQHSLSLSESHSHLHGQVKHELWKLQHLANSLQAPPSLVFHRKLRLRHFLCVSVSPVQWRVRRELQLL